MSASTKQKVLIVDDVIDNIKILIELLKPNYKTYFADNGPKALELARNKLPDLILLDIVMPHMDGYEVCQKLKADSLTEDIPVIFISAMNEVGDEAKGLEIGAVDYITKPISPAIVKARIKNHLKLREAMQELKRLFSTALDANPMTGLPGNNSIANRIKKDLADNANVTVLYADLDNFKAFNDKYGFALGDEVIKFTSEVFHEVISEMNIQESFIGHIGGDDFVLIVPSILVEEIAARIIKKFDDGISRFYSQSDIASQSIQSVNRKGEKQTFPIISISLAGVDLSHRRYSTYLEVNDVCAMTKKQAKVTPGSTFFLDRRTMT
ncbi:GGDEF domain-containing response regulator [Desulfopila aestuarii]|uniref:Diguanylate cyclase (GGDEF) domain-containing protein n=1 Tax=Desulfopila aestuarii DSM 18488 TaxID=1121416 RepID=A0A1M7YLJ6_9BACT|nr:response regulator [Desulfopila aestuarii]SHO53495.1 diguanylate cyclase (GGDEF) domain-containing protein [Desulfopila aestuarii DSM 18488]